jgi:hypothetical protein
MTDSAASTRQITPVAVKYHSQDRQLVITSFAAARQYVSLAGKKMKDSALVRLR